MAKQVHTQLGTGIIKDSQLLHEVRSEIGKKLLLQVSMQNRNEMQAIVSILIDMKKVLIIK